MVVSACYGGEAACICAQSAQHLHVTDVCPRLSDVWKQPATISLQQQSVGRVCYRVAGQRHHMHLRQRCTAPCMLQLQHCGMPVMPTPPTISAPVAARHAVLMCMAVPIARSWKSYMPLSSISFAESWAITCLFVKGESAVDMFCCQSLCVSIVHVRAAVGILAACQCRPLG